MSQETRYIGFIYQPDKYGIYKLFLEMVLKNSRLKSSRAMFENNNTNWQQCVEGVEIYKITLKIFFTYLKSFMQRIIQKPILKLMSQETRYIGFIYQPDKYGYKLFLEMVLKKVDWN